MGMTFEEISAQTGLSFDKKRYCLWGNLGPYKAYLHWFTNDLTFSIKIFAKPPAGTDTLERITEWGKSHTCFAFLRPRENRMITAAITLNSKHTADFLVQELQALVAFAVENGFTPCCSTCGREREIQLFALNIDGVCLCSDCAALAEHDVENTNRLFAEHKPSAAGAAIGILLGALLMFLLYTRAFETGTLSAIPLVFALFGMTANVLLIKRLAKWTTKTIAALSMAVCCVSIAAGIVYHYASFFADFNREQYQYNKLVLEYCDAVSNGADEYAALFDIFVEEDDLEYAFHDLYDVDDDELEQTRKLSSYIVECQTTPDCLRSFNKLLNSGYGDNIRSDFWDTLINEIMYALIYGIIFWFPYIKRDKPRYRFIPLESILIPINI